VLGVVSNEVRRPAGGVTLEREVMRSRTALQISKLDMISDEVPGGWTLVSVVEVAFRTHPYSAGISASIKEVRSSTWDTSIVSWQSCLRLLRVRKWLVQGVEKTAPGKIAIFLR
jgi:hypothetical protein